MNPILNFGGFGGLAPHKKGGFAGAEPPHKKKKKRIQACGSVAHDRCCGRRGGGHAVVVRGNMAEFPIQPQLVRRSKLLPPTLRNRI